MRMREYRAYDSPKKSRHSKSRIVVYPALFLFILGGYFAYKHFTKPQPIAEAVINLLRFDDSVGNSEKTKIRQTVKEQVDSIKGIITTTVETKQETNVSDKLLDAYVPVTSVRSSVQQFTTEQVANGQLYILENSDEEIASAIEKLYSLQSGTIKTIANLDNLDVNQFVFIPVSELTYKVKLLSIDSNYYLDNYTSGAYFRTVSFSGGSSDALSGVNFNNLPSKDTIMKFNQTGVTALTRVMMKKLNEVGDPKYFSAKIGAFLSDADITHVSNEVSFKENCGFSSSAFCSDPRFIETLKDSGVDLVELTGNHNNDVGSEYDTQTINLYHSLGWNTFGGGLNSTEAAKYHETEIKGTKIAFLGYNYADTPHGLAIATATEAGSNSFDFDRIQSDIDSAKANGNFVVIDVQYWECYAYPDGFVEYPICDLPIGEQESVFKKLIDMGADMVVGTQAHQPQIYEIYKGKPIYYGLGNLYFDQTNWPGTERGIILSHYFLNGQLIQTRLTPTIYDAALQTAPMDNASAESFLKRLLTAR
ncbi:CapA family protein [Candidatus Saccharibacteria bacterium]|nr:CapA family protein [Candidatus Saccharibacteria bacterium]